MSLFVRIIQVTKYIFISHIIILHMNTFNYM